MTEREYVHRVEQMMQELVGMHNEAIDSGMYDINPDEGLGKFIRYLLLNARDVDTAIRHDRPMRKVTFMTAEYLFGGGGKERG